MDNLGKWLNKWGIAIYAACGIAWLVGYLMNWNNLLWGGVSLALLTSAASEACDYHTTHNPLHLVIPLLTALGFAVGAWIGLQRLL